MKNASRWEGKVVLRRILVLLMVAGFSVVGPLGIAHAAKEIKVGVVVGMTGGTSPWGKRCWNTVQMIFDELNAQGGIKSMGGAQIHPMLMDHQSKPDVAGAGAEKLIRDGVSVIFGAEWSDAAMVASQVCQRLKIPFIDTTDVDPMITGRGFDYVFRTCPNATQLTEGTLEFTQWLVKKTGKTPKNVGFLIVQNAGGQASLKILEKIVPPVFNVAFKATYPAAQQDFTGLVSKMKGLGVDYVFQLAAPTDAILITRTYKEMDFNPMGFLGNIGGHDIMNYRENLGKDADYTLCTSWWSSSLKVSKLKELMTRYKNRFGVEFDRTDATVCNAISVLVDALERAGTDNPTKLRDALKTTNINVGQSWYLVPDGCKFDETNQNIKQKTVTFQVRNGEDSCIYPEEHASTKPVFPIPPWNKR